MDVDRAALNQIACYVMGNLHGRAATWPAAAEYMLSLVLEAGHGDHLEIGVLHGATLIMAALTKQAYHIDGLVIGIDPMLGYYPASPAHPLGVVTERGKRLTAEIEGVSGLGVTPEIFWENVKRFKVEERVRLVTAFSHPFPAELEHCTFASAYIDGDHYFDGPLHDWENVYPRIKPGGLVWFDDCNKNCPGVQRAAYEAEQTPGWHKVDHFQHHTFVVRRDV